METVYCQACGLLQDPEDGECLGCKLNTEISQLKEENRNLKKNDR